MVCPWCVHGTAVVRPWHETKGGYPVFIGTGFEPLARVILFLTETNGRYRIFTRTGFEPLVRVLLYITEKTMPAGRFGVAVLPFRWGFMINMTSAKGTSGSLARVGPGHRKKRSQNLLPPPQPWS